MGAGEGLEIEEAADPLAGPAEEGVLLNEAAGHLRVGIDAGVYGEADGDELVGVVRFQIFAQLDHG